MHLSEQQQSFPSAVLLLRGGMSIVLRLHRTEHAVWLRKWRPRAGLVRLELLLLLRLTDARLRWYLAVVGTVRIDGSGTYDEME